MKLHLCALFCVALGTTLLLDPQIVRAGDEECTERGNVHCTTNDGRVGYCSPDLGICSHCLWVLMNVPPPSDCTSWSMFENEDGSCKSDPEPLGKECRELGRSGSCDGLGNCITPPDCQQQGDRCNDEFESSKTCCPSRGGSTELSCVPTRTRYSDQCGRWYAPNGCAASKSAALPYWGSCSTNARCITARGEEGVCGGRDCSCQELPDPSPSPSATSSPPQTRLP